MTKLKTIFFSLFLMVTANVAMAGAGHSHGPITQEMAVERAERVASALVDRGIIPVTWKNRELQSVSKVRRNGGQAWQARFDATSEKSKEKSLYLFMSLGGNFMDANYTGK